MNTLYTLLSDPRNPRKMRERLLKDHPQGLVGSIVADSSTNSVMYSAFAPNMYTILNDADNIYSDVLYTSTDLIILHLRGRIQSFTVVRIDRTKCQARVASAEIPKETELLEDSWDVLASLLKDDDVDRIEARRASDGIA